MKRNPLLPPHTIPRTGARNRGNSTAREPRGRCSPLPRGARGRERPSAGLVPESAACPKCVQTVGPAGRHGPRAAVPPWLTASSLGLDAGVLGSAGSLSWLARPGLREAPRVGRAHGRLRGLSLPHFFLRGYPTLFPGTPRPANLLCSAPPPVLRPLASLPASHPCRPGGRSRVNIGRREPFDARGQGRSRKEDLFLSPTPGGLLVS